jgi:UDPglucose--hexose-1-phosphate uridylyltransferase
MSIRRNAITGDAILYAPNRAGRPNAFGTDSAVESCPFCPGNESQTPPEIMRRGDPWRVRAFPNKYPAVPGHEVIVESPAHDAQFIGGRETIEVYIERYSAHRDAAHVALFTNRGQRGGASIDHLHSQLMPLSFIPPRIEREQAGFARAKKCPLCTAPGVVIDEDEWFIRVAPEGSQHAYLQWIIPRRHHPEVSTLSSAEIEGLAVFLERAGRATARIASSSNVLHMNFAGQPSAHFYIEVFPRLTSVAGFELATGTFIDIIDPAAAARALR